MRNQVGKSKTFEVTSPYGHVFQVICRRGRKMDIQELREPEQVEIPHRMLWRIRRVAARSAAA